MDIPLATRHLRMVLHAGYSWAQSARSASAAYWSSVALFSIMLLTPIWQLRYLPLGDLPDHAAQLYVILNFEDYRALYTINWFTPYLLGYLLTLGFATVCSVPVAIKLTLSLCFLAIPYFFAMILRLLGGNRFWVWISFPTVYSFSFYWGFFSFVVAVPVALGVLAYMLWSSTRPLTLRSVLILAALSILLFYSHAMAWALVGMLGFFIFGLHSPLRQALHRFLPFVAILPLVLMWMNSDDAPVDIPPGGYIEHYGRRILAEISYVHEHFVRRGLEDKHWMRARELLSFAIGKPDALDYVAASLLLLLWPLMTGGRLRWNPKWWLPVICVVAAFMIVPYWIFDTAYVYFRFAAFLFPAAMFIYAFDGGVQRAEESRPPLTSPQLVAYIFGFVLIFLLLQGVHRQFATFRENDRDFRQLLDYMEPGRRVLSLIRHDESALRFSPAYLHFGSWYQAEKGGLVLMNFMHDPNARNVPVRYLGPEIKVPSIWDAHTFDWHVHQGESYDYFLIRAKDAQEAFFREAPYPVKLLEQKGFWQLYGRGEKPEGAPGN